MNTQRDNFIAKITITTDGFSSKKVLIITNVFDGGEGEGEALGELDATDDEKGDEAGRERRGSEMATAAMDFMGLDRHWDAKEKACGDVVESREDEGCGEVQVVDQCES
ncbi:hypothetical protein PVL29_023263 [Vitis rotundifolia]|uniref:Uncharacterized protein n=1 Tax=Vitis rotundifolia TaxID=103349 RepID=A0AA38YN86_VITRO|nr:hypothetical protein PVL29_023263 [Vitis rotundifolia]